MPPRELHAIECTTHTCIGSCYHAPVTRYRREVGRHEVLTPEGWVALYPGERVTDPD